MKRPRLIRIVLGLVVVLVLGCLSLTIFRDKEPRYQGRTLSELIDEGEKASVKFSMLFGWSGRTGSPDHKDWKQTPTGSAPVMQ